eukprot:UN15375
MIIKLLPSLVQYLWLFFVVIIHFQIMLLIL